MRHRRRVPAPQAAFLLMISLLEPLAWGAVQARRAEAEHRSVTKRPLSRRSEALTYGLLGGLAGGVSSFVTGSQPERWFGVTLIGFWVPFDAANRLRWRFALPPTDSSPVGGDRS